MKLKAKTVVILGAVIGLSVVLNAAILGTSIAPSFRELERREAERNMQRVLEAVDAEIARIASVTTDYTAWDDTYNFVEDKNKKYKENFNIEVIENLNVGSVKIYDSDNKLVVGAYID